MTILLIITILGFIITAGAFGYMSEGSDNAGAVALFFVMSIVWPITWVFFLSMAFGAIIAGARAKSF